MPERPPVLIESWLPVAELGIESQRERAAASALPPLYFLHLWWARRPLVASAGVVLASLLPPWSPELASRHPSSSEVQSDGAYQAWYLRLCGIWGDPIAARRLVEEAEDTGVRIKNPYTYLQAFRNSPSTADVALLHALLEEHWGFLPSVLDPTAGGGSIPYEAIRYGLPSIANDLNPIAATVLRAGVELPARFGTTLLPLIEEWGDRLLARLEERLAVYFPRGTEEQVRSYIFARTVACPRTGKPVPLSPSWWLRKVQGKEVAVRVLTEDAGQELPEVRFEIVRGSATRAFDPDRGTVAGGDAISPWDNLSIDGEYVKAEARAGRMGSQLYAVAIKVGREQTFRAPSRADLDAVLGAEAELARLLPDWELRDVLPSEAVPVGNDTRPLQYGMPTWRELFSPRQRLVHGSFVEEFRRLVPEIHTSIEDQEVAAAVSVELGLMMGKALNYNSYLSSWDVGRQKIRTVFDRHDFAFKWTYGEFEGATSLFGWCLDQLLDAYRGIAELLSPSDENALLERELKYPVPGSASVIRGNAGDLREVGSETQTLVCIDPPYYNNVMYSELSDYFYAWEKRTLNAIWPEFFEEELTDKKSEAVANVALFADAGKRRKELADADYEAKMQSIFAECHRVLKGDGVLTVMFTHKSADAWDALGMALMEAGFTIGASWPVNTESEQSLHIARKNAASSTIMLVCRKRDTGLSGEYFEDLEPLVREEARRALRAFSSQGISGVDLLLATYGPALSVISSRWPVFSSEADPVTGRSRLLRPEEALDAARAEVTRAQRARLVGREQALDPLTDFTLVAWDTFKAFEFPFDEARRLALAIGGLDIEDLRRAKILDKRSGTVALLPPGKRVRRGADLDAGLPGVYPEATAFPVAVDGVHTALYLAEVDGLNAAKAFLDRTGLSTDARFLATVQGLLNAIPRTKVRGDWVVREAEVLDRLCAAYFPTIAIPLEVTPRPSFEQGTLPVGE